MTGLRSALRVAVVAVLGAALLAVPTTPALAQQPDLQLGNIGNIELRVGGGNQNVQLRVENRGDADAVGVSITMTVPLTDLGVHIPSAPNECQRSNNDTRMDCLIPSIGPGQSWSGVAQVGVHGNSSLQAGESRNGNAEVTLNSPQSARQQFNVRLQGPERAPSVNEVSGFVTDESTGERISDARVTLVDSQGTDFTRTTNANGEFQFAGEQIAPGSLALRASKDGFEGRESIQQAATGDNLGGIQLTLRSTATPEPDDSPSPAPADTPTATASPVPVAEVDTSGLSFFTRLMIFMGVILLLIGIGAIAFLIYKRRKEAREEEEGDDGFGLSDDPTSGPQGPGPAPGSRGVYHPTPTQVRGAGPATAIAPNAALANAETSLIPRAGMDDATALQPRAGDATALQPRAGDATALQPRAGDATALQPRAGDATALHPRSGAGAETSMLPRAGGEPPGPRPPVPGSPPPPRSAAPTYGSGQPYGGPAQSSGSGYRDSEPGGYEGSGYDNSAYPGSGYGGSGYSSPAGRPASGAGYGPDPYARGGGRGGYDSDGYGGYDRQGQPGGRHGSGGGYPDEARRDSGHQEGGYDRRDGSYGSGYDQSGYQTGSYQQPNYPQSGHPRAGYGDQSGYDRSGPDRSGYDQSGYDQSGYDQSGYDQSGYDQSGYDRSGYNRSGYNRSGYDQSGYDQSGYDRSGYRQPGYDQSGYGQEHPQAGRRRSEWPDS